MFCCCPSPRCAFRLLSNGFTVFAVSSRHLGRLSTIATILGRGSHLCYELFSQPQPRSWTEKTREFEFEALAFDWKSKRCLFCSDPFIFPYAWAIIECCYCSFVVIVRGPFYKDGLQICGPSPHHSRLFLSVLNTQSHTSFLFCSSNLTSPSSRRAPGETDSGQSGQTL